MAIESSEIQNQLHQIVQEGIQRFDLYGKDGEILRCVFPAHMITLYDEDSYGTSCNWPEQEPSEGEGCGCVKLQVAFEREPQPSERYVMGEFFAECPDAKIWETDMYWYDEIGRIVVNPPVETKY